MSTSDSHKDRLVELEAIITHLQYDFETLNKAVFEQRLEIDTLKQAVRRLEQQVTALPEDRERSDPRDELPPHY